MHGSTSGVYQVGTLTVGASSVETITPVQSNSLFKNLTIVCKPEDRNTNVRYGVSVLFDGEVVESHSFTEVDDRAIAIMNYGDRIFPPNMSTGTTPGLNGAAPNPLAVTMQIENFEGSVRHYKIYSTFEEFDTPRFKRFTFNE